MSKKVASRKRPCRVCGKWFSPHPRVRDRQKTCGAVDCKKEWHRRKSAEWNRKNKASFKANYLGKKLSAVPSEESKSDGKSCPKSKAKKSCSESKDKQCLSVHVSLKSGLDPIDLGGVLSLEQVIVIEYIMEQIIRRMLPQKRSPGE